MTLGRRLISTVAVAVVLATALGACGEERDGEEPGIPTSGAPDDLADQTAIVGRVLDYERETGLAGARVSLYPATGQLVHTLPDGAYGLGDNVVGGQIYTVVADADGYESSQAPARAKSGRSTNVDIGLVASERALPVVFDPPVAAMPPRVNSAKVSSAWLIVRKGEPGVPGPDKGAHFRRRVRSPEW